MSHQLQHPGTPVARRRDLQAISWCDHYVSPASSTPLLELVESVIDSEDGRRAGSVSVLEGRLEAFTYVVPAVPADGSSVATWGEPRIGDPPADIELGNMTVGTRDGQPFVHFHAVWRDHTGHLAAGHLLPETVVVGAGAMLVFRLSREIDWTVQHDSEINLPVFHLRPVDLTAGEVTS